MKRLSTGALTLLIAAGFGVSSVIAAPTSQTQGNTANSASSLSGVTMLAQAAPEATPMAPMTPDSGTMATAAPAPAAPESPAMPPADFGTPPSGEVPILFNDHHVYSKPSTLRTGRVLAALVRGNSILVPLRSLFEQTGATVSYDPGTKTVDVSKPGSDVKLTVGRPEVVINGESRPLDVPPEIHHGTVLVPLRVLAEGMGAYVQWVPDRKVVVVRYVVATPPPPPPPVETPAPVATPVPTEAPTPTPAKKVVYERYVAGDFIFAPKVYNEFNGGNTGNGSGTSFGVKGAIEFPFLNLPWMVSGDFREIKYPLLAGSTVTGLGGVTTTYTSSAKIKEYDQDYHFGYKIADPRVYVGVGYLYRSESTGYPNQRGIGFGIEKLPDLDQQLSVYGSAYYYPNAKSKQYFVNGNGFTLAYRVLKYSIGGVFTPNHSPVFLDFGWEGERGTNKQNAPSNYTENGPFLGLGVHF